MEYFITNVKLFLQVGFYNFVFCSSQRTRVGDGKGEGKDLLLGERKRDFKRKGDGSPFP